jgi:hypothetical protein
MTRARGGGGIPHLQLFGQLTELSQYRVTNILYTRIILAHKLDRPANFVVFKVLHKSSAVYKR